MIQPNHFPTLRAFVVMATLGGTVLAGAVVAAQGPGPGGPDVACAGLDRGAA